MYTYPLTPAFELLLSQALRDSASARSHAHISCSYFNTDTAATMSPQEHQLGYPSASEIDISTLCNTASRLSLSSLRVRTVSSGRAQIRHTWPEQVFVDRSKLTYRPGISSMDAAASASTPNLSSSNTMATPTPARTLPKFQFAGDVFGDWLVADALLPAPPTSVSSALVAASPPSSVTSPTDHRVHYAEEEFEDDNESTPVLSTPEHIHLSSSGTLSRELVAFELDSLPNSAPPTPSTRHIRFTGAASHLLTATSLIAAHRATYSAPTSHICFLPLQNEHNVKAERKLKCRSASPCPQRRASFPDDISFFLTSTYLDDNPSASNLQLTRVHAHQQSALDFDVATLLSVEDDAQTARRTHSFGARLREFRQRLKKRKLQKLGLKYGAGEVQAYNRRSVRSWVVEQREIARRSSREWLMADL